MLLRAQFNVYILVELESHEVRKKTDCAFLI